MDRTAGNHPDWMVVKPFVTQASNCILPAYVVAALAANGIRWRCIDTPAVMPTTSMSIRSRSCPIRQIRRSRRQRGSIRTLAIRASIRLRRSECACNGIDGLRSAAEQRRRLRQESERQQIAQCAAVHGVVRRAIHDAAYDRIGRARCAAIITGRIIPGRACSTTIPMTGCAATPMST